MVKKKKVRKKGAKRVAKRAKKAGVKKRMAKHKKRTVAKKKLVKNKKTHVKNERAKKVRKKAEHVRKKSGKGNSIEMNKARERESGENIVGNKLSKGGNKKTANILGGGGKLGGKTLKDLKAGQKKRQAKGEKVKTGLPHYDSLIGGGYEVNSTNLVVGGSGSGKSIFATQYLLEGLKKGEKCLYVTFEEKKDRFYENMSDLGWDLEKFDKKGQFFFLEYAPIKVKTMLEEGGGEIERLILNKGITRMVIDSITSFALLFENELARREAALELFAMIRNWACTALLTLEEEPTFEGGNEPKTLEFEVDSMTLLYFMRVKGERHRFIEVVKMRGTNHSKKIFPFEIAKGGIKISNKAVRSFP